MAWFNEVVEPCRGVNYVDDRPLAIPVTVSLKDKNNSTWTDGTTTDKTLYWKINWKYVNIRELQGESVEVPYDGNEHTGLEAFPQLFNNAESDSYVVYAENNPAEITANQGKANNRTFYRMTVTAIPGVLLIATGFSFSFWGYELGWRIAKVAPTLTVDGHSAHFNVAYTSKGAFNLPVATNSDGAFSVSVSGTGGSSHSAFSLIDGSEVATASVTSMTNLQINIVDACYCVVTVNLDEGTNYTAASISFTVIAALPLQDSSWEAIQRVSTLASKAMINRFFKVGDTKTFTLNGTLEGGTFNNETVTAVLIGIRHNNEWQKSGVAGMLGKGSLHFMIVPAIKGVGTFSVSDTPKAWNFYGITDSVPTYDKWANVFPADLQAVLYAVPKAQDLWGTVSTVNRKVFALDLYEVQEDAGDFEASVRKAHKDLVAMYEYFENGNKINAALVPLRTSAGDDSCFVYTIVESHVFLMDPKDNIMQSPCFAV